MRQWDTRAVGQIAVVAVVWSSCLPVVVSADCHSLGCDYNGLSPQTRIALIAAGVFLIFFIVSCGMYIRRRRLRQSTVIFGQLPTRNQPSNIPKPWSAAPPGGYPTYYQPVPPVPAPAHTSRYPPHSYESYDTYNRNSQSYWSSSSNAHRIPEPVAPISSVSPRPPSSVTSRPISSLATTTPSIRSSARQDDYFTHVARPSAASSPASLSSTRRDPASTPLSLTPSSPPPRAPSVVRPSSASVATPVSNAARPPALSPMPTGTHSNLDDPPPAYTPI